MAKTDPRFTQSEGVNVYTGNELLIKGALEAGVSLYSSYPGSPVAETLDVISQNAELFLEHGIEAVVANNEALAAARVNGSQALPLRAVAIMKSVGFNVATDVFETSNLAGANPNGGAVVMVGDDPHCSSTQTPADSRYKSRSIFMPVIMPAGWQEIKDWVDLSFQLSAATELYVTYLITTAQADGGGTVTVRPNRYPAINTRARHVVAVDVPSGLDATTGNIYGVCVKADKTVTFSFPKKGFFRNHGPRQTGKVVVVDIGIPSRLKNGIS